MEQAKTKLSMTKEPKAVQVVRHADCHACIGRLYSFVRVILVFEVLVVFWEQSRIWWPEYMHSSWSGSHLTRSRIHRTHNPPGAVTRQGVMIAI